MRVLIMGGGQVGEQLARVLTQDTLDVVLIEQNEERARILEDRIDAQIVMGSGISVQLLRQCAIADADLFVSATGNDEANLVAASLAKKLGAKKSIARIGSVDYFRDAVELASAFHVDQILSPQEVTASYALEYLRGHGSVSMEAFLDGQIYARTYAIDADSPLVGKKIGDTRTILPEHVLVGLVRRDGESIIPRGDDVLLENDMVTFIGKAQKFEKLEKLVAIKLPVRGTVTIAGASSVGVFLVQKLINSGTYNVRLLELSSERAREVSELLNQEVLVLDATSQDALSEAHLETSAAFVAATDADDRNILAALIAKEFGVKQRLAVVRQQDLSRITRQLDINHILVPREIFADRILETIRSRECMLRRVLEDERAEILEFKVRENSIVAGTVIRMIPFPRQSLVTAIQSKGKTFIANGDDRILPGDRVAVLARREVVPDVIELFRAR